MNKETFLEELRGYLRILEDQEQEDILAEYAQHIDMKLQKGLTEEEAIRDFGPMRELAAEILEAYHVKPEFDEKPSSRLPKLKESRGITNAGESLHKTGSFLKEKCIACIHGIRHGFQWCGRKCRALAAWMWKPFSKLSTKKKGTQAEKAVINMQEVGQPEADNQEFLANGAYGGQIPLGEGDLKIVKTVNIEQRQKSSLVSVFIRGLIKIWNLFVRFCIWWVRLFWNLLWLFMALLFGGMTLITLAGVGTILVLLPQGYPLAGTLLICLGGMLCMGALSCGSYSLILHGKKEGQDAFEEETEDAAGNITEQELHDETEEDYEKNA